MSFYLRKSIRVGPFRFNLSKSGVGVSAGIKGFRLGTGPRGNYVHMGRSGLYYRTTLPAKSNDEHQPLLDHPSEILNETELATHAPLEEIESANIFQMTDSSSSDLLNELNSKRKKIRFWPIALILGGVLTAMIPWPAVGIILTTLAIMIAYYYDQLRKTVVLFYELEDDIEPLFNSLHHAAKEMSSCKRVWHIEAEGKVHDKKYHAGADNLVTRKTTTIEIKSPPFVKTNIAVPVIGVGKQKLYFFPDRVLVFENNAVGGIDYKNLNINTYVSNFIEAEKVPRDAQVVGKTWKYVNKKGGPDKRFSDNPEFPIAEYGYIDFTSKTGLNERICLSRTDKAEYFQKAILQLADVR
jgi:hypothetical protein